MLFPRPYFHAIVARVPDALIQIDQDGYVVAESDRARLLIGEGQSLIGRSARDIFAAYPSWRASYRFAADVSDYVPNVALDELDGNVFETVIFVAAPSDQVQDLVKARHDAVAASAAQERFFATLSHEIRTPLNAIMGMTQLLMETPIAADQRSYVQTIYNGSESLRALINDLLDFSRLRAGSVHLEAAEVDVVDLAESAVDLLADPAARKGLRLYIDVADDVPRAITGDVLRLRQILLNLLSNAVKFTAQGVVAMTVRRRASPAGAALLFSVTDTGIGIAPEYVDRLFREFSQADVSTTRNYGGSGLGLAICKLLANHMGGDVHVESEVGRGTTFTIDLPIAPGRAATTAYRATLPQLAGVSLVVMDPLEAPRDAAARVLRHSGAQVQACANYAAVRRALQRDRSAALVIVDPQRAVGEMIGSLAEIETVPREVLVFVAPAAQHGWQAAWQASALSGVPLHVEVAPPKWRQALARLHRGNAGGATTAATAASASPTAALSPTRQILVADDNLANQSVARAMLARLGCAVTVVGDGATAVAVAMAHKFSLVLLDLDMPVLDGAAAARLIAGLPDQGMICALTASVTDAAREACRRAGMSAFLDKPLELAALRQLVTAQPVIPHLAAIEVAPLSRQRLADLVAAIGMGTTCEIVDIFLRDTEAIEFDLGADLTATALARGAHRLRGAADNVGAGELAAVARYVEQLPADATPVASLLELRLVLLAALGRARRALSAWLSAGDVASASADT